MTVDERLKDAGGRLADLPVVAPSFGQVLDRRRRRRRIAVGTLAAVLVLVGAAGAWVVSGRQDGDVISTTDSGDPPGTTTGSGTAAVTTFDLTLADVTLITDEAHTPTNTDVGLWKDERTDTYLSLTVRPGMAAAQPVPTGLGPMTEDADFPSDQGRAWITELNDAQGFAGSVRGATQRMWWTRTDGDVWLLTSYWYAGADVDVEAATSQLRNWATSIRATASDGGSFSYVLEDPTMELVDLDQAGDLRSRARVWTYEGQDITLLIIEDSAAAGLSNLLARGVPDQTSVAGRSAWIVEDQESRDTVVGWRLDFPIEAWATLTIPEELANQTEAIIEALQPVGAAQPEQDDEPSPTTISTPATSPTTDARSDWVEIGDGPLSPRSGAVGVWTGSEVLVIGGEPDAWCPPTASCAIPDFASLADGAAFDPVTGAWRSIANSPLNVSTNARAVTVDDAVYVLAHPTSRPGGEGGFLRYDVQGDSWSARSVPGDGLYEIAAIGETIVAYARSDEAGERPDLIFDPSTDRWRPMPADPLSPSFDRTMIAAGGGLYLFAKDLVDNPGSEQPALVRAARFDPETQLWELRSDSEILGSWSAFAVADEIVFPESGSADGGQNSWGRSYPMGGIYNTTADQWSSLPEPSMGAGYAIAGVLGESNAGYVSEQGHVLRAADREWIDVPALPTSPGDAFNRTVVAAGTDLFVLGGESWSGGDGEILDEAYIWSPSD